VLNAYDIYPSVLAAGAANPELSDLMAAIAQASAGLNISIADEIENTPGTFVAPTNEASDSVAVYSNIDCGRRLLNYDYWEACACVDTTDRPKLLHTRCSTTHPLKLTHKSYWSAVMLSKLPPCCLQAIQSGLGTLPITPTPAQLHAVLKYHFCPTASPKGLLVSA
jgi:hypothetical protein